MINATFCRKGGERLTGFEVSGHAGLADFGSDVCCASISSAVMMAANTVTDAFKIKADVAVEENLIKLSLSDGADEEESVQCDKILLGLLTHMYLLSEEFGGRIRIRIKDI